MGKSEVKFSTPLPAGVTKDKALAVLHNHEVYFQAAEHFSTLEPLAGQGSSEKAPGDVKSRAVAEAQSYKVRNEVPNPVFDSKVDSTYQMLNLSDGLWYFATSPMGVENEGLWTVADGELRTHIQVECNMMLKTLVKGQVEKGSKQIAEALIQKMQG